MRLVLTLLARDECDVIEANIRYHLFQGVDSIIVTDNGSVDGTREILAGLAEELPIAIIDEPEHTYEQSAWVTRMARRAAAEGADWVVNADADEFWTPEHGRLRSALESLPADVGSLVCQRVNMLSRRSAAGTFPERMTLRDELSHHARGQRIGPKVAHRAAPDVVVAMGNHTVEGTGLGGVATEPIVEVLHFPCRSLEQWERAVRNGGESLRANAGMDPQLGWHWRELYDTWRSGGLAEAYERLEVSDARAEIGLRQGLYREDFRVRDRLRQIGCPLAVG